MGTLSAYYSSEHGGDPVVVSTAGEVDALIDRIRAESPDDAPILMQLYVSDDVHGQELSVGIRGDRGVLRYAGREWFEGVYSVGRGIVDGEPLLYFYADHDTEFPSNSEVALTVVRDAVKQYLDTSGARPEHVEWQPGR